MGDRRGAGHVSGRLSRLAPMVAALLVAAPAPVAGAETGRSALERYRPVLRYAAEERVIATSVEVMTDRAGTRLVDDEGQTIASASPRAGNPRLSAGTLGSRYAVPGKPEAKRGDRLVTPGRPLERGRRTEALDTVYGHLARGEDGSRWLQYWLFYEDNPQDRGVFRTGRHAGDWEFAQVRLDPEGKPDRLTMSQHSWSQSCDWSEVERSAGAPVLYVANASHATYHRPGTKDRPWPDPNDEANGKGRTVRPALRPISADSPSWVAWPGRWGESERGIVPTESSSPRGPAHKDDNRFEDPAAYDAGARACGSGPPGRPWQTPALLAPVLVLAVAGGLRRRRAKRGRAVLAP